MHWTHHGRHPYRDVMSDLDRFIAECRAALAASCPAAAVGELARRAYAVAIERCTMDEP
jgi:hypothetical protein